MLPLVRFKNFVPAQDRKSSLWQLMRFSAYADDLVSVGSASGRVARVKMLIATFTFGLFIHLELCPHIKPRSLTCAARRSPNVFWSKHKAFFEETLRTYTCTSGSDRSKRLGQETKSIFSNKFLESSLFLSTTIAFLPMCQFVSCDNI